MPTKIFVRAEELSTKSEQMDEQKNGRYKWGQLITGSRSPVSLPACSPGPTVINCDQLDPGPRL